MPAGLGKLTPALDHLARFLPIDRNLIRSAAAASRPAKSTPPTAVTLRKAVGKLSRQEYDEFLVRLLQGERGLDLALRQRLQSELKAPPRPAGNQRPVDDLFAGAERIQAAEQRQAEAQAEKRRLAELKKLAEREEQAWQSAEAWLQERHWSAQAKAVELLVRLGNLADDQKQRTEFNRRVKQLRQQHGARSALMKRFDAAGLP